MDQSCAGISVDAPDAPTSISGWGDLDVLLLAAASPISSDRAPALQAGFLLMVRALDQHGW
jgi:hypothetical protein